MQEIESTVVEIHLGGPTAYTDYPDIPERFARDFKIHVYADRLEKPGLLHSSIDADPADGELVSNAIRDLGVWEVVESITMMSAFAGAPEGTRFIDFGCHVGWFSLLALSFGIETIAIDGDPRMLELLSRSRIENGFKMAPAKGGLHLRHAVIDENWKGLQTKADNLIVKMDIEGAELHAYAKMAQYFAERKVSHCLMEVSPCFEDYYPKLVGEIIDHGYEAFVMPEKRSVPRTWMETKRFLRVNCRPLHTLWRPDVEHWISQQHQIDVIFVRPGAAWG
jgi:hypothetical protein